MQLIIAKSSQQGKLNGAVWVAQLRRQAACEETDLIANDA